MATSTNAIKDAAVSYAARGFKVTPIHFVKNGCCSCNQGFKCKSGGKHPLFKDWADAKVLTPEEVELLWTKKPKSNVGIVTGRESGIFVFDVDPKDGGNESMVELLAAHDNDWPTTYAVKTGSGGWHFYFNHPDFDPSNSAGKLGKGLDIRGKGGQVVAPPSVSNVGEYKVARDAPIADAPDWLLELLKPKERQAPAAPQKTQDEVSESERRRLDGYVDGAVANEIHRLQACSVGKGPNYMGPPWNNTVYEVSANLIQLANAPWSKLDDAWPIVEKHAPQDPGFDLEIIQRTYESAQNKVGTEPAAYPPDNGSGFLEAFSSGVLQEPLSTDKGSGNPESPKSENFLGQDLPSSEQNEVETFSVTAEERVVPEVRLPGVALLSATEKTVIPVVDGVLVPDYEQRAVAEQLGFEYRKDAEYTIAPNPPLADGRMLVDLEFVSADTTSMDAWLSANLRSATPKLFWSAMGVIAQGVPDEVPTIVFKGGGEILERLAARLQPAVGSDLETMLFGVAVATHSEDDDAIIFEFTDEPLPDDVDADALLARGLQELDVEALNAAEDQAPDESGRYSDYRSAQLHRGRLGYGSLPRAKGR